MKMGDQDNVMHGRTGQQANLLDISIVESEEGVRDPWHFKAKECPGQNTSVECRMFTKIQDRMNQYFNDDQNTTLIPVNLEKGEVFAGKREVDRQWYRVRMMWVQETRKGPKALCYFVDHGQEEFIPVSWLRQLPPCFREVAEQVKTYCLWAVQPLTMEFSATDLSASKRRSKKWDIAAINYMKQLVKDSSSAKAEVCYMTESKVYVRLYLKIQGNRICVNDLLCEREFAVQEEPEIPTQDSSYSEKSNSPKTLKNKPNPEQEIKNVLRHLDISESSSRHGQLSGQSSCDESDVSRSFLDAQREKGHMSDGHDGGRKRRTIKDFISDTEKNKFESVSDHERQIGKRDEINGTNFDRSHQSASSGYRDVKGGTAEGIDRLSDLDPPLPAPPVLKLYGGRGRGLDMSGDRGAGLKESHDRGCDSDTTGRPGGITSSVASSRKFHDSTVSDSEASSRIAIGRGRGYSFLSATSDETLGPKVGDCGDSNQSGASHSQSHASQTSPYLNFKPSRRPKCAGATAISPKQDDQSDKKSVSILKTSPSISGSESGSVRFADRVEVCRQSRESEDWKRRKGKEEGRRLLAMMNPGGVSREPTPLPRLSRIDQEEADPFLGVVVHGIAPPNPIKSLMDAPFAELIKQTLDKQPFISPLAIQAFCWPAVLRGRHMVGIAPPNTGKTLAYLLPLLTQLFDESPYTPIKVGNGPLALILVPSWKKAQQVFDLCKEYIQGRARPRVSVLFAGGSEDSQTYDLLNGRDVVISTPPCLRRVLDKKYTNLNRLCHLVLDDAEILTEVFRTEIQSVMSDYARVLEAAKQNIDVPRQRILLASQWTRGVQSFMESYLHEPIVCITSKMESAVYGRVKHVVHMCKHERRLQQLQNIMQGCMRPGNKILIFSSKSEEVKMVYQLLKSRSIAALMYLDDLEVTEFDADAHLDQWRTLNPEVAPVIMVLSDQAVTMRNIHDATVVIHFDLPRSKTVFGNRMFTMLNQFYDIKQRQNPPESPVSHIMVTEQCQRELKSLSSFLDRSGSQIPKAMKSYMAGIQVGENEDEDKAFCQQTKAFGFCVGLMKCRWRHRIIPSIDCPRGQGYPALPKTGEIKMRMCHIMDASHYYVRLLEHRSGGRKEDLSGQHVRLIMNIAHYFGIADNRIVHSNPKIGDLCCVQLQQHYYRVEIKDIYDNKRMMPLARVWFVDEGRTSSVDLCNLITLPDDLREVPYQAVEVFLCRVKPMDEDNEWTKRADDYIYEQLNDLTLDGCIVLSMGNTLWLDPIVERQQCGSIQVTTNHRRVRDDLLKKGLATNNPQHLQKLYALCEECHVDVPQELLDRYLTSDGCGETLDTDMLPEDAEYHDVYVSAVVTPALMHVQRKENVKEFEAMLDEINDKMEKDEMKFDKDLILNPGTSCLAKFPQDNRWYRARIVDSLPNETWNVYFCDFGDSDVVTEDYLRALPDKYTGLPCQAIECTLAFVNPTQESWDTSSGDALWDMTHYLTGEKKLLVGKVISKYPSTFAGCYNYTIDLFDTTSNVDIHLAQELVWQRHAMSPDLKELMAKSDSDMEKIYTSPVSKLCDLCADIYWGEDVGTVLKLSEEVSTIVTRHSRTNSNAESLVCSGGLTAVCRLVGYVTNLEAHRRIVEALTLAVLFSPRTCSAIIEEGVAKKLVRCLEQNSFPELHHQAAKAISRLVTVGSFKSALEFEAVTTTLCDLLDVTDNPEIQKLAFHALANLLDGSERACREVLETSVCGVARDLLTPGVQRDVIEAACTFLARLAVSESSHTELKREAMLKSVIGIIEQSMCGQCIYECALFCQHLARVSRRNKTLLLEHHLVLVLKGLDMSILDSKTTRLCQELATSIAVQMPPQEEILNQRVQATHEETHQAPFVPVIWTQNTFRVDLRVKLKDINREDFTISESNITFRSSNTDKHFSYDLFGAVLPQRTNISLKVNYATVSLKKKEQGKWSRLLRQKEKPPGLKVDFERLVNTDSEESNEDADFVRSKRRERKLPDQPPGNKHKKRIAFDTVESTPETDSSDLGSFSDDERKDETFKFGH